MNHNAQAQYTSAGTAAYAAILDSAMQHKAAGAKGEALLDSVKQESHASLPKAMDELAAKFPAGAEGKLLDAVTIGAEMFRAKHGVLPTGDVIEAAIQQGQAAFDGVGMTNEARKSMLDGVLNTASALRSDPQSLQPNRAVVATLTAIAEAIPFASYLPVDIGSNEAKLAILRHTAGSAFGDYALGALMDGTNAGLAYTSSSRLVKFTMNAALAVNSKFTTTNLAGDQGFCDPNGTGVPVLRGRTVVYVNGRVAARDAFQGSGATSPISGSVRIGSTDFSITGAVTVATGAITITPSAELPAGTVVYAEAFVDFETSPALAPLFSVNVDTFQLFANPWRGLTKVGMDSQTQMSNELGLDPNAEAIISMRNQFEAERHYLALRKVAMLGKNLERNINFEWATRSAQMNRAQIFQDVQAQLLNIDQDMANATMDHGVTHYYVGSWLAGIFNSLPDTMFQSSGITARAGIYRVGRLFNRYEIYYTPRVATQAADLTSATMIGVGRASNVARCPIVLGDAVAPTFVDMATLTDFNKQAGIYGRNFTEVNPHDPSALGCTLVNLSNLAA